MEAGAGIEPARAGFAVPSITTLLPGPSQGAQRSSSDTLAMAVEI